MGVKAVLTISLVLEGIATYAMRYMTNYDTGFWLRVIVGLGAGAVMSACTRALTEWFPPEERGTAFGILLAAPSAGIVLSNYIAPALNAALGWRGVFEIIGIITAVIGVLILFLVRTSSDQGRASGNPLGGFKVIFSSRELILTSFAGFCLLWSELGIATWANTYIKTKLGYSVATAGLVMIFYGIGGVVAPLLSGYISAIIEFGTYDTSLKMQPKAAPAVIGEVPKLKVLTPWDVRLEELGGVQGNEDLIRRPWEMLESMSYTWIWQWVM